MSFDAFICYKRLSAQDFAEILKKSLEEFGVQAFLDIKDIPTKFKGTDEWTKVRDSAVIESKTFIFIITAGFDLSPEIKKELSLARKYPDKQFIYFRHKVLKPNLKIVLDDEELDFGKQNQVSFDTEYDLVRKAHSILIQKQNVDTKREPNKPKIAKATPHMKELARAGFAGILLDAASALRGSSGGVLCKVSPTRIGAPLDGGVPTAEIIWSPRYAGEVRSVAFEDFEGDDYGWRKYSKRIKEETKAEQYAPYAESHLQNYPEINALIRRLHELDKKRFSLIRKIPSGYLIEQYSPLSDINPWGGNEIKIVSRPSLSFPSLSRHTDRETRKQPKKAMVDDLAEKLTAVENESKNVVKKLTDHLLKLRLMVLNGKPLKGTCDLCA